MKHVHQFYKTETHHKSKYVWKCANCSWFVHAGLEYVIVGKDAVCWNCDGVFKVESLNEDKLRCFDCRGITELSEVAEKKINELKEASEDDEAKRMREKFMKGLMK